MKKFLWDLYEKVDRDDVFNGAAALGYYFTLALFPALILLMALIPYLPIDQVDQAIMDLLEQALPSEAYSLVSGVVKEVAAEQRGGLLSLGILGTLWAASTGMYGLMKHLNHTFDVKGERPFWRSRLVAIILSIVSGGLVLTAFSLVVLGGIMQRWLADQLGFSEWLVWIFIGFRWLMILGAFLLGLALIYRFGPNAAPGFAVFTPGSIFAVVMLVLTSTGFSIYAHHFADYSATYGSIGAVIMLMLWLYLLGMIILVGSSINALLMEERS